LEKNNKGQVWIETVIYTLIGLSLIGLVLAIMTPQIKESKDRAIIDKTIESMNLVDSKINEVLQAPGNKRKVELELNKGELYFNSTGDSIYFEMKDSKSKYSEPGVSIGIGRINLTSYKLSKDYRVLLELKYKYNVTFDGKDSLIEKKFSSASVPYNLFIENKGIVLDDASNPSGPGTLQIDFSEGFG
jgi:hypothetical protein